MQRKMNPSIAVLMTCHNRKEKTLKCLESLFAQDCILGSKVLVYLVDDGSTDGTGDAVREAHPEIKVLSGSGDLFWCGGMRLAFSEALKQGHDFYLWLNDDVVLYPAALEKLLCTYDMVRKQGNPLSVVSGSMQDPCSGELTYGGCVRSHWFFPLFFKRLNPQEKALKCTTVNGNCLLIPASVARLIGNLDSSFKHMYGDNDYGLRLNRSGGACWISPGFSGTCPKNDELSAWRKRDFSCNERWQMMKSPKGPNPREWMIFCRRHGGFLWFFFWLFSFRKLIFGLWKKQ